MKADILLLAAGLGTRLRPLTNDKPKPMVELAGRTLLDINLSRIKKAGFERVIVNVHYFAEKLIEYLGDGSKWGLELVISHEKEILGTGGAVRNIKDHLREDFLFIYNCDILVGEDFSFSDLLNFHINSKSGSLATLVLRDDPEKEKYGVLGVDDSGRILTFLGQAFGFKETLSDAFMFSGISVLDRKIIKYMRNEPSFFSLTQGTFMHLLSLGKYLGSVKYSGYWNDVGTHERLAEAEKYISKQNRD